MTQIALQLMQIGSVVYTLLQADRKAHIMIILITGTTHTGKTLLAQKTMERYQIPYVSQDHIKMGLIRSGYTTLTAGTPDEEMTEYLWPVTREMIKTAIENGQNLIVEGCYIPFDWKQDFDEEYLREIKYICLCFTEKYIEAHYSDIMKYESAIENRMDDGYCTVELLKRENARFAMKCKEYGLQCLLIDEDYGKTIANIEF